MFAYCGNNPVARSDSMGSFWNIVIGAVVGAVVSAAVSIGSAIANNEQVDVADVVIAAVSGGMSGAIAATGIPVAGQVVLNGLISGASAAISESVHYDPNRSSLDTVANVLTSAAIGAVGGLLGGNGSGNNHLTNSAGRFMGKMGRALAEVFENGISNTIQVIAKAGKYYYSQIASESLRCGIDAVRPIFISNIPNAIYQIID